MRLSVAKECPPKLLPQHVEIVECSPHPVFVQGACQVLDKVQVQAKCTNSCLSPVDDTKQIACLWVDHEVSGAEVAVEEYRRQLEDVVRCIEAFLDHGTEARV